MQVVPLKTRSRACKSGTPVSVHSDERATGIDSPVRVDASISIVPVSRRASAEDAAAFFDEDHIARDEFGRWHDVDVAVTNHSGVLGQVVLERLDRPLGLHLLQKGEECIENDDDHDGERHGDDAPEPGQSSSSP